ncbi:MAG: HRDC domain-containing protein, partial [Polyangiaceae bacterium]
MADPAALSDLVATVMQAERVAVDIEASGMFAYRARPCTVQLAWDDGATIAIVDVTATPIQPLGELLGTSGPIKIVHDVAFDARLLADAGIALGHVHDTSLAAHMLGRAATGLAALLEAELGAHVDKAMQHHDWRVRPLDERMLDYLAADVFYLEALDRKLWTEVTSAGIEDAVVEETRHRIASALAAAKTAIPAPAYFRVKGAARMPERDLAALRVAAEIRERHAEMRDVPPHQVASADALIVIARARPATMDDLARVRGLPARGDETRAFALDLIEGLRSASDRIPEEERAHFEPVRLPPDVVKRRREREARLLSWRRAEAKERGVNEQVVLPGHCLKDAAD